MAIITEDMISDKITRRDVLPLSFLKKSAYTGSKRRFNYKMEKTEIELPPEPDAGADEPDAAGSAEAGTKPASDLAGQAAEQSELQTESKPEAPPEPIKKTVLRVYWWTGLLSYEAMQPEDITCHDVEFSDVGIDEAIVYLNEMLCESERTR